MSKLNNLLDFKEYSELKKFNKPTKRTEIGGDVVNEKKKAKGCDECSDKAGLTAKQKKLPEALQKSILKKQGKAKPKADKEEEKEEKTEKKGLTAKQKKLPEALQKSILKKQGIKENTSVITFDEFTNEGKLGDVIKKGAKAVNKALGGEVSKEKAMEIIKGHPVRKKTYDSFDDEKKDKYVKFWMSHPNATAVKWDDKKKDFVLT